MLCLRSFLFFVLGGELCLFPDLTPSAEQGRWKNLSCMILWPVGDYSHAVEQSWAPWGQVLKLRGS